MLKHAAVPILSALQAVPPGVRWVPEAALRGSWGALLLPGNLTGSASGRANAPSLPPFFVCWCVWGGRVQKQGYV